MLVKMKVKEFLNRHPYIPVFIAVNIVFLILYGRFVLLRDVYIYTDIGSDTLNSNYPNYVFFSNLIRSGHISQYYLSHGLGKDVFSSLIQYVNPLNLIVILFPERLIYLGILIAAFIKLNLISFFGYGFFRKITGDTFSAFAGALLWTFSGYTVLWGQQYAFCTALVMFTVCLFFLQAFLEGVSYGWKALIPLMALFLLTNYYYFYMCGIFYAVYTLLYMIFARRGFIPLIKKLLGLLGTAVLSVVMAGAAFIPVLSTFTGSSRTADLVSKVGLTQRYERQYISAFLGRFLSNNTFGVGDNYSGLVNYYEIAILFVSSLFLFAFIYLLFKKSTCVKVIVTAVICVLMLTFRSVSQYLIFNASSQRYTFIICLAEIIAICFFLKYIRDPENAPGENRRLTSMLIAAPVIYAAIVAYLFFAPEHVADSEASYHFDRRSLVITAGFAILYWIVILIYKKKAFRRFFIVMTSVLLIAEAAAANWLTVNDRGIPSVAEFNTSLYYNGAEEALAEAAKDDDSLFRAAVFSNDPYSNTIYNASMVNEYNGTSSYSSTNPESLITLTDGIDAWELSDNFITIGYQYYYLYTLLGGKYLIAGKDVLKDDLAPDTDMFEPVCENDGVKVYRNRYALPFGYVYDLETDAAGYGSLSMPERQMASTGAFYYTGGDDGDDIDFRDADLDGNTVMPEEIFLGDHITEYNDCDITVKDGKMTVTKTGDSPYFIADVPGLPAGAYFFTVGLDVGRTTFIFYLTEGTDEEFTGDNVYFLRLSPEKAERSYLVPDGAARFRLNLNDFPDTFTFNKIALTADTKFEGLRKLAQSSVRNASFDNDTYTASVDIKNENGMFCVPILYDKNWSATANGEPVNIQNINSGMCGIALEKGTYDIVMTYQNPLIYPSLFTTLAGIAVYVIILILTRKKKDQANA